MLGGGEKYSKTMEFFGVLASPMGSAALDFWSLPASDPGVCHRAIPSFLSGVLSGSILKVGVVNCVSGSLSRDATSVLLVNVFDMEWCLEARC